MTLTVAPRGREVVLTFSDDGRGIDGAAVVKKARETGILAPNDPEPRDPFSLLFRPGFSTADSVSEFSGRGVGLDVVKESARRRSADGSRSGRRPGSGRPSRSSSR